MPLATLYEVPRTTEDLHGWSFAHMAHHRDICRAVYEQFNGHVLSEYVLDPLNPEESQVWLAQHQAMHQQMDAVLGIAGYDLMGVDWLDPEQVPDWIRKNAVEHAYAGKVLNIG